MSMNLKITMLFPIKTGRSLISDLPVFIVLFFLFRIFRFIFFAAQPIAEIFNAASKFACNLSNASWSEQEKYYDKNDDPFCAA